MNDSIVPAEGSLADRHLPHLPRVQATTVRSDRQSTATQSTQHTIRTLNVLHYYFSTTCFSRSLDHRQVEDTSKYSRRVL
jgi:hypothetical protein